MLRLDQLDHPALLWNDVTWSTGNCQKLAQELERSVHVSDACIVAVDHVVQRVLLVLGVLLVLR